MRKRIKKIEYEKQREDPQKYIDGTKKMADMTEAMEYLKHKLIDEILNGIEKNNRSGLISQISCSTMMIVDAKRRLVKEQNEYEIKMLQETIERETGIINECKLELEIYYEYVIEIIKSVFDKLGWVITPY